MDLKWLEKCVFGVSLIFSATIFSQEVNSVSSLVVKPQIDSQLIEGAKQNNAAQKVEVVGGVEVVEIVDEVSEAVVSGQPIVAGTDTLQGNTEKTLNYKKMEFPEGKSYLAPSSKFDLSDWSLSVPSDLDKNGRADQIKEKELSKGFANRYFHIAEDGGMVFTCPVDGYKTSKNTTYTRSELREMLRAGDYKIKTKGPNKNNWVLKSSSSMYNAGGYNGQLNATLAVNHVTTTGSEKQVGRVIIGQIHAEHNEPLRIYYRKLPNHTKGSIYFAHEDRDDDKEVYHELIGSKSSKAEEPVNGIALNEKFSYQILVLDNTMAVRIIKEDKSVYEEVVDISKSGYDDKTEYMYFKAGVYNQNKTGQPDDYVQATFYSLENKHQKYVEPSYDD